MASSARPGPVRRALARLTPDGGGAAVPEILLPEQRLLDVAMRYGRHAVGENPPPNGKSAAAAGVKVVAPTEPSDSVAPAWVRRLGDRERDADASSFSGSSSGSSDEAAQESGARSGPRLGPRPRLGSRPGSG